MTGPRVTREEADAAHALMRQLLPTWERWEGMTERGDARDIDPLALVTATYAVADAFRTLADYGSEHWL